MSAAPDSSGSSPGTGDWLRAIFPALHDPKVALASVGLLLLGVVCIAAGFALGTRGALRLLGSIGFTALVTGGAWLTTGRIQGLQGALSDLNSPVHWTALVAVVGALGVSAWRVGLLLATG